MHKLLVLITFIGFPFFTRAQGPFPPPAGQSGSTAVAPERIIQWASEATVVRGPQNIADPEIGNASVGDEFSPVGEAGINGVVSLGDGGSVTLRFDPPMADREGDDFAVFENGFSDEFLELAFVEVSSDGINFYRFESTSLTDTTAQVDAFGSIDASNIDNLAGKYRGGFGTPFDLNELSSHSGLDLQNITHVKVLDVIGSLTAEFIQRDGQGNPVNDPWPTPFPSSGFDLDAVGVIGPNTSVNEWLESTPTIYPNPTVDLIQVTVNEPVQLELFGPDGKRYWYQDISSPAGQTIPISMEAFPSGIYQLRLIGDQYQSVERIVKL